MSRYDLVFMDLDDTLLDFRRTEREALEGCFAEWGLPLEEAREAYKRRNHELWAAVERGELSVSELKSLRFRLTFADLGWKADAEAFGRDFVRWLSRGVHPLPGAEEACGAAAASAVIVIVTNGIAEVQRARIAAAPFSGLVRGAAISEEVGSGKPDPAIFRAALAISGLGDAAGAAGRPRMLMLGDSLASDIQGGANFGVDTCWYNPRALPNEGTLRPTYEIRHLGELAALL